MTAKTENILRNLRGSNKLRVLFVCLGNICRSPAAEGVMRTIVDANGASDRWHIDSAGMGSWHIGQLPDQRMRVHAMRRGYNLTHLARKVKPSDFDEFDIVIPMDAQNRADLMEIAPSTEAQAKIVPMSEFFTMATRYDYVPDPYYEGAEGFELVLDLLENGCAVLFDKLN